MEYKHYMKYDKVNGFRNLSKSLKLPIKEPEQNKTEIVLGSSVTLPKKQKLTSLYSIETQIEDLDVPQELPLKDKIK